MGRKLIPWTTGGLLLNHVPFAPLPPHTIVTTAGPYAGGWFSSWTSNQYSWIAVISVVYSQTPRSRTAASPSASPSRISPHHAFIASLLDSLLLPSPNRECPDAHVCPAYGSKLRRNGNSGSARSVDATSRISSRSIPPHRSSAAHAGSWRATSAAALRK